MRGKKVLPSLAAIVTAAYLIFAPQPVRAEKEQPSRAGKWYLGLMGELGKPQTPSEFKDYFGNSASFGLTLGRLPFGNITGELSAQYTRFFPQNSQPMQFNAFEAGMEIRAYFDKVNNTSAAFYIAAGANLALTELNINLTPQTRQAFLESGAKLSEQKPAVVGGAGVMLFAGNKVAIDLGARYHYIATSDEPTSFTTVGGRFNFLFGK